mgnify:FL=1
MKLSIGIVIAIIVQAFGIIWYVAQLDSNVSTLNSAVTSMQQEATTVDVAVLQADVNNLKDKVTNITVPDIDTDSITIGLWDAVEEIEDRLDGIKGITQEELAESINQFPTKAWVAKQNNNATVDELRVEIEQLKVILLEVTEENPLITQENLNEALTKKAQKGKTNRLLGENSDRLGVIEVWMNGILEAEAKKQAKKDKKKDE